MSFQAEGNRKSARSLKDKETFTSHGRSVHTEPSSGRPAIIKGAEEGGASRVDIYILAINRTIPAVIEINVIAIDWKDVGGHGRR